MTCEGRGADGTEDDSKRYRHLSRQILRPYGPGEQGVHEGSSPISSRSRSTKPRAIVKYREGKGGIKDWDDPAKTPGLTASKIEPLKKRLKYS